MGISTPEQFITFLSDDNHINIIVYHKIKDLNYKNHYMKSHNPEHHALYTSHDNL